MRPHKIRDYVERRDPDFERKMAAVLHVDKEVEISHGKRLRGTLRQPPVVTLSDDEKPGLQALAPTSPDRPCGQLNLIPDRPQARHQPRQAEPPEQERSRSHFDAATAKRLPCLPWLVAPGRFPRCKPEPRHL